MFGKCVSRWAAALAIAAVLLAASPAGAAGPPGPAAPRLERSWMDIVAQWFGGLWGELVPVSSGHEGRFQSSAPTAQCDSGMAIDPNGCPAQARGDEGAAIDPNG